MPVVCPPPTRTSSMTVTKSRAVLMSLLLTATALGATAAYAQQTATPATGDLQLPNRNAPKAPPLALSQAVGKPLTVAQVAMAAKKWPDALVAAKAAMDAAKS